MTALTEFLFPAPARRSAGSIVSWWEKRRLGYNLVVGSAGLLTMAAVRLISALPPYSSQDAVPAIAVLVVGVLANLCYCLGPAAEIAIEKLSGGRVLPTGPVLFRMGLTFSAGLVLLPTLVFSGEWLIRVIRWLF